MEHLTLYHYLLIALGAGLIWTFFASWIVSLFQPGGRKRSPQDHEEFWQ